MAIVFITGSTDGLGRAMACRSRPSGGAARPFGGPGRDDRRTVVTFLGTVIGDLRSAADTRSIADQVNAIGRMDAVIHNAGVYGERSRASTSEGHADTPGAAFVEKAMTAGVTPEHFDKTFNTNARGTYFTVQKALPYLNDGASIILVASAGKNKGLPGRSTYSATKAALRSFARTWTSELKDRKIRTNVLSPGPVDTPMFDEQFPSKEGAAEARKQITAMTPLARLARPEEIASAALFLASDQSSYVAGIDLPVDGGLTAV
jgi:NAD(P)-dependent dehydrogenase (short-subunit alcohol dehydrogenase family)